MISAPRALLMPAMLELPLNERPVTPISIVGTAEPVPLPGVALVSWKKKLPVSVNPAIVTLTPSACTWRNGPAGSVRVIGAVAPV